MSPGHTLVIPRHHVPRLVVDVRQSKGRRSGTLVDVVKADLDRDFTPDAYNVGFNAGQAAGQTIFHLHVHVVAPLFR